MNTAESWPGVAESSPCEGKPTVPLTDAQRDLAAENTGLAYDLIYRGRKKIVPLRIAVEKLGDERAVAEALYGLVKAARGYDPRRGFKFSTYACNVMIRAVIQAGQSCGRLTERFLNGNFERVPFVTQFGGESSEDFSQESIPDGSEEEEDPLYSEEEVEALRALIAGLSEKERAVLKLRYWDKQTLVEAGKAMGVSKEAIRQVQERAVARLRRMLVQEESES